MFCEKTFTVDTRDLDCFDHCRASALLGYLQEAAGLAAAELHVSNYELVENHRCIWMLARMHYILDKPLGWRDELTVKTWHRGGDKTLMYREFDLLVNGERAGEALSTWVVADMETRALARMSDFPELAGTDGGALIRDTRIPHLNIPRDMPLLEERQLHYSDTDTNGHVNNTRYADFLCDALGMERAPRGVFVRELQLRYVKECRAGETLLLTGEGGAQGGVVQGADPAGQLRFQGQVKLGTEA